MIHLGDRGALRSGSTAGRWVLGVDGGGVGNGNCLAPSTIPDSVSIKSGASNGLEVGF